MRDNNFAVQTATCLKPIMTRRLTDGFFNLLIPFNFILWLAILIYEIEMDPLNEGSPIWSTNQISRGRNFNPELSLTLGRNFLNITIYAVVSIIGIIAFLLITMILKARWIVYAAISSIVVTIITYIMLIPWVLLILGSYLQSRTAIFAIIIAILTTLYLLYQVTVFVCTNETNVNFTAEMINRSCTAIRHSFVEVAISLLIAFLSIIFLMITLYCTLRKMFDYSDEISYLRFDPKNFKPGSYLDFLRLSIFFITGLYIFNCTWNFGFTIMSDFFANVYARSDDDKNRRTNIFESITRVAKHHTGTIAFMSMPILPSICALIMAFKTNLLSNTKPTYGSISFFSKMCLIMDIPEYALVQTSINGYKALRSISEMFELHRTTSLLFLTLNAISTKVIEIIIVLATIIGMIIRLLALTSYYDMPFAISRGIDLQDAVIYQVIIVAIYVNVFCKLVTRSAMCTYAIYQMTSVRMSETLDSHIATADQSI